MSQPSAPDPPPYQAGPPPSEPPPKYEEKAYAPGPQGEGGYNQGNPPYPPQGYQGGPGGTVYSQPQSVILVNTSFGPCPVVVDCPYCYCRVTTTLTYEAGALTWLAAGIICLFGCWLGCCLIPFCVPDLQDVEHRCPECYRVVGRFRRLS